MVFGCPEGSTDVGEHLMRLPGAELRTARVEVLANASGYQELTHVPPGVQVDPDPIFVTYIEDGLDYDFIFEEDIAHNSMMEIKVYKAKGKHSVARLVLYDGAGEPWVRYQFLACAEFLNAPEKDITVGFRLDHNPDAHAYDRILGIDPEPVTVHLRDKMGIQTQGYIVDSEQLFDDTGDVKDPMNLSTAMAIYIWDLDVGGDYRGAWGPWLTVPNGDHGDRNNQPGLLAHRGIILDKRPGRTGDQAGFGRWKHLDVISRGLGGRLSHDKFAIGQEACRPIWHFDTDGSFPTVKGHPSYRSWSETMNWNTGVSPDRFRRIYHHGGWYDGWLGMDEEHYSCAYLKERVLLSGDILCMLILRMKAFHLKTQGRWPGVGRALGRLGMGAVDCYMATGDEELLKDMKARLVPAIKGSYISTNGQKGTMPSKNPRALRLWQDDPWTGIKGYEWIVWEDAQAVGAMDILWQLFNDPELKLMTWMLAKSIVHHGTDSTGKILKAIAWNGPDKPVGPASASSDQTDYHSWAYDTWAVAARLGAEFGDTETVALASKAGEKVRHGNYFNRDSYLAPAP